MRVFDGVLRVLLLHESFFFNGAPFGGAMPGNKAMLSAFRRSIGLENSEMWQNWELLQPMVIPVWRAKWRVFFVMFKTVCTPVRDMRLVSPPAPILGQTRS